MKRVIAVFLVCILLCGFAGIHTSAVDLNYGEGELELLIYGDIPSRYEPENVPTPAPARGARAMAAATVFDVIYNGLLNMDASINIASFGISRYNIGPYIGVVLNNHPELFAVNRTYRYSYYTNDNIADLLFTYTMTKPQYTTALATYNAEINRIVSGIQPTFTDLEKVVYVHDYLASNFEYDQSLTIYDAYQFLTLKTGVCQSYMLTFMGIMNRLGITTMPAYSDTDNHTWNLVYLDGSWYHLDVTFDDPTSDRTGIAKHGYLLISSAKLATDNKHRNWYVDFTNSTPTCSSTKYQAGYVWLNAATSLTWANGYWYYIQYGSSYSSFCRTTSAFTSGTTLKNLYDTWNVNQVPQQGYWGGYFSGIFTYGTRVCYNTPLSVAYYDTVGNTYGTLKTFSSSKDIYGCTYNGRGTVTVDFKTSPNVTVKGLSSFTMPGLGDVDGNGSTDAQEIVLTRKYLLNGAGNFNWGALDVTGGVGIDIHDLVRLKKYAAGLIPSLAS